MFHIILICCIVLSTGAQNTKYEGEPCEIQYYNNTICKLITNCLHAKLLLKNGERPDLCGFNGKLPIVCCPPAGVEADRKCDQYTSRNAYALYFGTYTKPKEFRHMANLGYEDGGEIKWLCGGSLISEYFVLTAAHCINSAEYGPVKWIRIGDLDLNTTTDDAQPQNIQVKKTFIHPKYKPPSHYHDVALIELINKATFNLYVNPACLRTKQEIEAEDELIATGWGKTDFAGETSSHLLKIKPNLVPFNQCSKFYSSVSRRRLEEGIKDDIQICAGHPDGRDSCQGDSGGPLQIKMPGTIQEYYDIVGITSFGKACGVTNSAGVYVRTWPYIEWIENIVWS